MKNYLTRNFWRFFGWLLLAGATGLTGCQTADQADSGDMASVEISGHTDAEILQAAARAFLANGYQQVDSLTFEKQGTHWDKLAYGGWSSNPVWIRMRLTIISPEVGQTTLGGNVFAIVDHGEASMEQENKLYKAYGAECKKILDQAKASLDASTNSAAQ
jgi:hypothetical protein